MEQLAQYGIAGASLLACFSVLMFALRMWSKQIEAERHMFRELLTEERAMCAKHHAEVLIRLDGIDDKIGRIDRATPNL